MFVLINLIGFGNVQSKPPSTHSSILWLFRQEGIPSFLKKSLISTCRRIRGLPGWVSELLLLFQAGTWTCHLMAVSHLHLYLTPCICICHHSSPEDAFMPIIFIRAFHAAVRVLTSLTGYIHTPYTSRTGDREPGKSPCRNLEPCL